MPTGNDPTLVTEGGFVFRIQPPADLGPDLPVMLLIHGLSGDENVMWIFSRSLPSNYWLVAPRAPLQTSTGYSWVEKSLSDWPHIMDFAGPAAALMNAVEGWKSTNHLTAQTLDVMGFSQGAAMAYAMAAFYPHRINRVIALAGFLPREDSLPGRYSALHKKSIYIAHGSKDETVPVSMAEEAVQVLNGSGALVTYCESDTGHKLSAGCLRGLETFISQTNL